MLGWIELSEKTGLYLILLQLAISERFASLLPAFVGLLTGMAYEYDFLGMKRFRLPSFLEIPLKKLGHWFISMVAMVYSSNPTNARRGGGGGRDGFLRDNQPTNLPTPNNNNNTNGLRHLGRNTNNNNNNLSQSTNDFYQELPPPDETSIATLTVRYIILSLSLFLSHNIFYLFLVY